MTTIDFLFELMLRFCLVSFVLLGGCVLALRFFRQPVERIRLIQITLLSILATAIWCGSSLTPTIELAWLPANVETRDGAKTTESERDKSAFAGKEVESPFATNQFDPQPNSHGAMLPMESGDEVASVEQEPGAVAALNSATPNTSDASKSPSVLSLAKWIVVSTLLAVSLLQAAHLLFGFLLTGRLIAKSSRLNEKAEARARAILSEFSRSNNKSQTAESGSRGCVTSVDIACSDRIVVPIVSGVFKPTIILPEHLASNFADPLELKHSLAHEWKHIEQRDLATWQLVSLAQIFLWLQPWYWVMRRELRISQDQIADEFATRATDEHAAYAATLMELSRAGQTVFPGALTMAGTKSNLYRRIEMLLSEKTQLIGFSRKRVLVAFASLMAVTGLLLASLQLSHAAAPVSPIPEPIAPAVAENDSDKSKDKEDKNARENTPTEPVEHFGYVYDARTKEPIEGVTVTVRRMNSKVWEEVAQTESTTNEDGKYVFSIPPEQLSLSSLYILFDVDHPEYAGGHCGSYSYSMIVKNLKFGDRPFFEKFYMAPGAKISGRLVDRENRPVAGAHLRASSRDEKLPKAEGNAVEAMVDDDGRFEIVVCDSGPAKLSIIPTDHGLKHIELGDQRGDLGDIVLLDGIQLTGEVRNSKGEPMDGLWVNVQPLETEREASYEMLRSAKLDASGKFETRPLKPGSYKVTVETKATGAIEKQEYANFFNIPPSAMFVQQTIEVTEDSIRKPLLIQAVPHVTINMQYYNSKGEKRSGHSPYLFGKFDEQRLWIRKGMKTGKGGWSMMVPHGVEDVELQMTTNEHSALTIQFDGQEPSTQERYRFAKIEEDIDNIRIVRYVAPILQLKIVDEAGVMIKDAEIRAFYTAPMKKAGKDEMIEMTFNQVGFEKQSNGLCRSSQLVPGHEVELTVSADGYEPDKRLIKLEEGEDELLTVTLKEQEKNADGDE